MNESTPHSTAELRTSLFGGLVEFPLLVSVSTVAFTFTAHQTAKPSQGLLACHSWSRFVLCQRDRAQIRGTDTYAYACGDNEFWRTDITKDVSSTSARGFFGFDLGCMGASYSVCDQIAELWRNDPQVENRACIQRELFLHAAAPALRERERERVVLYCCYCRCLRPGSLSSSNQCRMESMKLQIWFLFVSTSARLRDGNRTEFWVQFWLFNECINDLVVFYFSKMVTA